MVLLLFPWTCIAADIAIPHTGVTSLYVDHDDGNIRAGIPHPIPRFTDNGDGTVTDNLTDLVWLKNANCIGPQNWNDAIVWANSLHDGLIPDDCGLQDDSNEGHWRMPNIRELVSLINFQFRSNDEGSYPNVYLSNTQGNAAWQEGNPFDGVQRWYWSSTNDIAIPAGNNAHVANFNKATTDTNDKSMSVAEDSSDLFVWPVRDLLNP